MGNFESSIEVAAGEQVLLDYLSDVSNLPKYFARMYRAEATDEHEVYTEADVNGTTRAGHAWFNVDDTRKHIEWGSEGDSGYSGQIDVTGDSSRSTVTVRLHTERVPDGDPQVQQGLDETVNRIKQLVEGGAA